MKRNRKAKILATLGPASSSSDIIENIFKAGCDVFRLNFSHGSVETHRQNLKSIRNLEEKYDKDLKYEVVRYSGLKFIRRIRKSLDMEIIMFLGKILMGQ